MAILSFCGRQPIAPTPEQWEAAEVSSRLLTSTTHRAVIQIVKSRAGAPDILGSPLTESERRSLELIATAMTAKEVADVLGVQERTVRYYLDRAAEKLGVNSRKEAVLKAVADGIVDIRKFPSPGFSSSTKID